MTLTVQTATEGDAGLCFTRRPSQGWVFEMESHLSHFYGSLSDIPLYLVPEKASEWSGPLGAPSAPGM